MSATFPIKHEHSQEEPVFLPENTHKSLAGYERECVPYGRGEGLVDSPRHPATGVFPPILPHHPAARRPSRRGEHRRVHRGYTGAPLLTAMPRIGGDSHGA